MVMDGLQDEDKAGRETRVFQSRLPMSGDVHDTIYSDDMRASGDVW